MPEDSKIMLTLFFSTLMLMYSACYAIGIVWKHHSLLPILAAFPHRFPVNLQMKPSNVCCVLGAKLISNVDGVYSGIMSWLTKTIKPRPWDYRVKWCRIIIIITLKDLHWQKEGSQEGLWGVAVQIEPPVDDVVKNKAPKQQQ